MKILAVDCATSSQSVALLEDEVVRAEVRREAGGSHARWILPSIDEVLRATGLALKEVDGLAVSIGPGSFTGVRVGVATMLGLRAVTGLPLAGVSTLEALAWNVREVGTLVCAVLKGRTGEAYWARYRWEHAAAPTLIGAPRVGPVEDLGQDLDEPTVMVGDGWLAYREPLLARLGEKRAWMRDTSPERALPSAAGVGWAARRALREGRDQPIGFSPLYVQRSEAEIAWERRQAPNHEGDGPRGLAPTGASRPAVR